MFVTNAESGKSQFNCNIVEQEGRNWIQCIDQCIWWHSFQGFLFRFSLFV